MRDLLGGLVLFLLLAGKLQVWSALNNILQPGTLCICSSFTKWCLPCILTLWIVRSAANIPIPGLQGLLLSPWERICFLAPFHITVIEASCGPCRSKQECDMGCQFYWCPNAAGNCCELNPDLKVQQKMLLPVCSSGRIIDTTAVDPKIVEWRYWWFKPWGCLNHLGFSAPALCGFWSVSCSWIISSSGAVQWHCRMQYHRQQNRVSSSSLMFHHVSLSLTHALYIKTLVMPAAGSKLFLSIL